MKISALIQGLSIAAILLVAGSPAYGASEFITSPEAQLDDDLILDIGGRPGDTISFVGFIDTTGLTVNLQSITTLVALDSNEITGFEIERTDDDAQFFPISSAQTSVDPNTGLNTIIGVRSGLTGFLPNSTLQTVNVSITLGSELNNDGQTDYRIDVLSAIDANGRDVTDQFGGIQEFEIQPVPVPEPSSVFGLVIAGGFGAFLRKQKRKV